MKYLTIFLLALSLTLFACGSEDKKPELEETTMDEIFNDTEGEQTPPQELDENFIRDEDTDEYQCDQFLNNYEKWANDYIDLIAKWKKNPTNAVLTQEFQDLSMKAGEWVQQWKGFFNCANTERYKKRYDEIAKKLEKKSKEYGLE